MTKICLIMLVKNDAETIIHCLNSVAEIIDMVAIIDAGSTDNTQELILSWGQLHQIPTRIHQSSIADYDFLHNTSLVFANSLVFNKEFEPFDYFCYLDAPDKILNIYKNFDKSKLSADWYPVLFDEKYPALGIKCLHKASLSWQFQGRGWLCDNGQLRSTKHIGYLSDILENLENPSKRRKIE